MNEGEFLFSIYGVLMGFCLAEVLAGLARVVRGRDRAAFGNYLLPMLGIVLLVDISLFWGWMWDVREALKVTDGTILAALAITSVYYIAAYSAFPRNVRANANLEAYFFQVKSMVLGLLLIGNAFALWLIWYFRADPDWCTSDYASEGAYFILIGIAFLTRSRNRAFGALAGALGVCLAYVALVEIWPVGACQRWTDWFTYRWEMPAA